MLWNLATCLLIYFMHLHLWPCWPRCLCCFFNQRRPHQRWLIYWLTLHFALTVVHGSKSLLVTLHLSKVNYYTDILLTSSDESSTVHFESMLDVIILLCPEPTTRHSNEAKSCQTKAENKERILNIWINLLLVTTPRFTVNEEPT